MEENKQNKDHTEENKSGTRKSTGHTWIGDKDEIRPDSAIRPVTRQTIAETKVVRREKRPYRGFITDEEVRHAEAAAEVDRRSREESKAAREKIAQTRIYNGLGSGLGEEPEEENKPQETRPVRSLNIWITDRRKFRRLIALAAVFALLALFEISFFVMKANTDSLPEKTAEVRKQTEEVNRQNKELRKESDRIGELDQLEENRDSWQRIKDTLME